MDPIADFLTAIRNGYLAKKETISVRKSKMKSALAGILVKQGFLLSAQDVEHEIKLTLHYLPDGQPILTHIKRISKPGVRRYVGADSIPGALSGAGITILSTPAGILTDKEARTKRLGGEIICQLW